MPKISIHEKYATENLKLILPTILLYVTVFWKPTIYAQELNWPFYQIEEPTYYPIS